MSSNYYIFLSSTSNFLSTYRTEDKIAALEAKLQQMQDTSRPSSSVPLHPSLPKKPPALAGFVGPDITQNNLKTTQTKGSAGSMSMLGKKPTLEELMRSNQKSNSGKITKR